MPSPQPLLTRRQALRRTAGLGAAAVAASLPGCAPLAPSGGAGTPRRLLMTSAGKTGLIHSDGSGLRWLEFDVPGQATWQPGPAFSDGRRVIFLSMETRRDGPGRPFEEYYTRTPTHIWAYDLVSGALVELATRDRTAVFYTPALLVGDTRLLVQVVKDRVGQIWSMNLDGSGAAPFTQAGEGLPYGLSASPDGKRVAFHLASPQGYQVWTSDAAGGDRKLVAAHPDHLYFGTSWSPGGEWVLYQDCRFRDDPGHDWSDVCVGRPDGGEHRVLTRHQAMWFGATYGPPGNRGGGSNVPAWTRDGKVLFPRRLPGSKVPWEYQAGRPDVDHFNREYRPELARGGTEICRLDPLDGSITPLVEAGPQVWDFRATPSPDGEEIAFCRAATGGSPALWILDASTGAAREIATGFEAQGVDHPRWLSG